DKDMDEMAVRRRLVVVVAENSDLPAHAGAADTSHPQARGDAVRKADAAVKPAAALDAEADDRIAPGIEPALADQEVGDGRVEIAVLVDVVDVAVDVVVEPAGRDLVQHAVVGARGRRCPVHGASQSSGQRAKRGSMAQKSARSPVASPPWRRPGRRSWLQA